MTEQEIIQQWKSGLSKEQLAQKYKRQYNMKIRNIRASIKHRHDGKFITNYQALRKVEFIIYNYLMKNKKKD